MVRHLDRAFTGCNNGVTDFVLVSCLLWYWWSRCVSRHLQISIRIWPKISSSSCVTSSSSFPPDAALFDYCYTSYYFSLEYDLSLTTFSCCTSRKANMPHSGLLNLSCTQYLPLLVMSASGELCEIYPPITIIMPLISNLCPSLEFRSG